MASLLKLLEGKEIKSTIELATLLGSSEEMVQAKLERYEQLGYVKKTVISLNCSENCSKCRGCSGIKNAASPVVYWERIK